MSKWRTGLIAVIAAMTLTIPPAQAQQVTADPARIADILREKGYRAEIDQTGDSNFVRTSDSGVPITILFMNCADGKNGCTTIEFYTGFSDIDASVDKINRWNREERWVRAYIDAEQDPVIEMDLNLDFGGMSPALFWDNFETFLGMTGRFRQYLNE